MSWYGLFVCLFGACFRPIWDVTMTGEGLHILTYARHSWPLSSEGSLACHTLLWLEASIYNGHLRGPVTITYCRASGSGAVTTCFYDVGLSRLGFENPTFRLRGQRSSSLRHRHSRVDIVIESSSYIVTHRLSKVDGNKTYIILNGIIHLLWT